MPIIRTTATAMAAEDSNNDGNIIYNNSHSTTELNAARHNTQHKYTVYDRRSR